MPLLYVAREVQTAPHFVERLSAQTAVEGSAASLSAEVTGVPLPTVLWSKDGQQLAPPAVDKHYHIEMNGSRAVLRFDRVSPMDAGWYQCTAVNAAGTATSRAKLTVQTSSIRTFTKLLNSTNFCCHKPSCVYC